MTHARRATPKFTDPALQAVYDCLAPARSGPPADTAEAIAAREGLDLAADLAAVRRRTALSAAARRRTDRSGRRSDGRTLESHAFTLLSRQALHLRTPELRTRARARARLGLWPEEMQAWIAAVGVDGAAVARDCRTAGIALAAMGVVLDGMRVKHRLRGGESAFSVLARAAACGRSLNE
ncbi:hypothetical protein ACFZA1_41640 [Streptomyces filipinensis]|uniref:hypothetical protein n=1 Tax=Streptomyces filipinensis TaxID=66887 RepID=UPI0036EFB842